jgi:branched-chain amino acid transport system ATP-binding protein
MITAKDINAGYGKIQILYNINFMARDREIVTILGPNGSGKSTFLKTLAGHTDVYSGKIYLDDEDITKLPTYERVRRGIIYVRQINSIFLNLNVKENLLMAGYLLDKELFRERLETVLAEFPILKEYYSVKVRNLSGGERQILAIAMALLLRPKIIMLDEPSANLSPKLAEYIFRKICELRDKYNLTIIFAEQAVRKALEISDRAYLLVNGRIIFEGSSKELYEEPELGKLYLGIKK